MLQEQLLAGITVVEWSAFAFAPFAGQLLADLGANVIKVESPAGGDPARGARWMIGSVDCELPGGRNALFESFNRRKRSVALDFRREADRNAMDSVLAHADVFLHNFRPGVPEKFGLGYDEVHERHPHLVYATASGYGIEGPDALRPGLDYVGQARAGLMWSVGHSDDPPYYSTGGTADMVGALVLAFGIAAALAGRESEAPSGQRVDVSHLGASMALQAWCIGVMGLTQRNDWPRFDRTRAGNPLWNHYACQDGEWIALSLLDSQRYWSDFVEAMGVPELRDDERFATEDARRENCEALIQLLEAQFATRPRFTWEQALGAHPDFIWDRVQRLTDLADDPQVTANGYLQTWHDPDVGPVTVLGPPVRFSRTPATSGGLAPALGEHTEQVLTEVGVAPGVIQHILGTDHGA